MRTRHLVSYALLLGIIALGGGLAGCGSSSGGGAATVIGPQLATVQVDLATLDLTITQQPSHVALTAPPTATWGGPGMPLRFDLEAANNYPRLLFNLKAVVTGITGDAGAVAMGDGMFDGKPFTYYGPEAIDLGASALRQVRIDGVTQTTGVLEITFEFLNHRMMLGSADYYDGQLQFCDASGSGMEGEVDINQFGLVGYGSPGTSSGYSNPMEGVFSPDGRYFYCGCRNQPAIITVDMTTLTPTLGEDLTGNDNIKMDDTGTGSLGFTRSLAMSPDAQFLYVVLVENGHLYENVTSEYESLDTSVHVIKIQISTMTEVGRATLLTGVDEVIGKMVTMTADGTKGALALKVYSSSYGNPAATVQGKLVTLDLGAMTFTIHDVSSVGTEVCQATISPDGSRVYFVVDDAGDNLLRVLDLGSNMISTVGTATSFTLEYVKRMPWGPDGRLYLPTYNGFAIYNPATDTLIEPTVTNVRTYDIAFTSDSTGTFYYLMRDDDLVECFDITTDTSVPSPADGGAEIDAPDFSQGHAFALTPN